MGCHGGLGGAPYGLAMFVKTGIPYGEGFNLSEYGEWRWSPMGLAGRDPIFHAQLESELALVNDKAPAAKDALTNLCLSCHGAMGQRQLASDAKAGLSAEMTSKPLNPNFKLDYFYLTTALDRDGLNQKDYEYHKYGNLAREGVSCTICHHIDKPDKTKVTASGLSDIEYFLMKNTTGRYERGPDDVLNGPFEKVAVFPMKASLGITPKHSAYIKDSQLCGTCHAINLPNIDATYPGKNNYLNEAETIPEFKNFPHSLEQATFLEWQNSVFAKQDDAANFKSCQDCHMPGGFVSAEKGINLPQLVTQVATIEDTNNPMVDNGARADDIHVPVRDNYKRHELVGLNVFVESMFNQFEPILGVSRSDFMTSATNGNNTAMDNMVRQAREKTVELSVTLGDNSTDSRDTIVANVTVTNKVGHRFPSGVGFRRAVPRSLGHSEIDRGGRLGLRPDQFRRRDRRRLGEAAPDGVPPRLGDIPAALSVDRRRGPSPDLRGADAQRQERIQYQLPHSRSSSQGQPPPHPRLALRQEPREHETAHERDRHAIPGGDRPRGGERPPRPRFQRQRRHRRDGP